MGYDERPRKVNQQDRVEEEKMKRDEKKTEENRARA